jgi:hypothetical protein
MNTNSTIIEDIPVDPEVSCCPTNRIKCKIIIRKPDNESIQYLYSNQLQTYDIHVLIDS